MTTTDWSVIEQQLQQTLATVRSLKTATTTAEVVEEPYIPFHSYNQLLELVAEAHVGSVLNIVYQETLHKLLVVRKGDTNFLLEAGPVYEWVGSDLTALKDYKYKPLPGIDAFIPSIQLSHWLWDNLTDKVPKEFHLNYWSASKGPVTTVARALNIYNEDCIYPTDGFAVVPIVYMLVNGRG